MFIIPAKDRVWEMKAPQIMGIINTTPDSFYDQSRKISSAEVINKVHEFIKEGVNVIDIGGQSTRPGAIKVDVKDEMERVIPIIKDIRDSFPDLLISIDTYVNEVANEALIAGANIVNDISCGQYEPEILKTVAKHNAGFIGMHVSALSQEMHKITPTTMEDIIAYFKIKKKLMAQNGITHWVVDPGFGFGKTVEDNFNIIKELASLSVLDLPILIGVSRKSSIYKTLGIEASQALNGTTVVNTIGLINGAHILRVHDVKEAQQIIQLLPYLQ